MKVDQGDQEVQGFVPYADFKGRARKRTVIFLEKKSFRGIINFRFRIFEYISQVPQVVVYLVELPRPTRQKVHHPVKIGFGSHFLKGNHIGIHGFYEGSQGGNAGIPVFGKTLYVEGENVEGCRSTRDEAG